MEIKMVDCPVCGASVVPLKDGVYTVRADDAVGLASAFAVSKEPKLWDAMDCGVCGCQVRLARRLRPYVEDQCECCCGDSDE